jgi:hypothetical protein
MLDTRVVQGWSGLHFFYKKNIHARIAELSLLFTIFFLYTNISFPSSWKVTDASSIKDFILTAWTIQNTVLSPSSVWYLCSPRCTFIGPNNADHWGLSQGCKEGSSWFFSPLLPMSPSSNLPYGNKCHAVGWSWQFPGSFLPNHLVRIIPKQVIVILCINCYIMWKKINMNHFFTSHHSCWLNMNMW